MTTLSTAVQPYFDDFSEDKQFYEILFRPSNAIQARELNQMQTILQKQIERHGRHVFVEGSMVIPGQISVDTEVSYVKLNPTQSGVDIETYLDELVDGNVELTGSVNGVKARILHWEPATETDPTTIYVKYVSNDPATGLITEFAANEVLTSDSDTPRSMTVMSSSVSPIGLGSTANIQRGVYFVNGRFVLCKTQTIVLDRYSTTPTYSVGLLIKEAFITPEEDESLLDNSQGSSNYAAPGAHRLWVDLELIKKTSSDTENKNFILLAKLTNGELEKVVTKTDYSELEKTLARRTYDESGDYVVSPFNIQLREHRNNDRGEWTANTSYLKGDIVIYNGKYYVAENAGLSGTVAPTHTMGVVSNGGVNFLYEPKPTFNNGVFTADQGGDAGKIAVGLEPGKAYVRGHEIDKQSTSYVAVSKARDYQPVASGVIQPDMTSLVKITNMVGSLDITKFPSITLRDASASSVGTAKARYIEWSSGTAGSADAIYTLGLFDIQLDSGKQFENDVRSFFFDNTTGTDFTADAVKVITQLTGAITTASGSANVTGLGTKFSTELSPGQYIRYFNGGTELVSRVLSIQSDTQLTLASNASATTTNVVFYRLTSELSNATTDSLLFPVSVPFIKTLRSNENPSLSTTNYYTKQRFADTCVAGAITITTTQPTDTFVSATDPTAFLVVNLTTGAVINPTDITLGGGSTSATITVGTSHNTATIAVIAKVRRVLKERSKTMTRGYSQDFTTQTTVQSSSITLSQCDVQKLRKVVQYVTTATGEPIPFGSPIPASGVTEIDITNQWILQGNQKDAYYDFSSIKMAPGAVFPNSPIRVWYDYYSHGNTGDFFCVDSYSTSPELPPLHRLATGETINLRDYVDFRPTRLTSSTWSSSFVPAIGEDFTTDYSYYLARRDHVVLDGSGNFIVVTGSSGDVATEPHTLSNTMTLYKLDLTPATEKVDSSNIKITRVNNRRYTMKDIGDLDRRLTNVEYYTALNLLEEQTKNLQLFDSSGNLMFKNGFLVDSFADMKIGDTNSHNFRCAIDTTARFMRPTFDIDVVNLIEHAVNDIERADMHYRATGGKFTLPYSEVSAISQMVASHMESVTPYIQMNFVGEMYLNPNTDDWHETSAQPEILINDGIVPVVKPAQIHDIDDRDPRKRFFQNNSQYYWWNHWQEVWIGRPDSSTPTSVAYDPNFSSTYTSATVAISAINENTRGTRVPTTQGQIQLDVVPVIREEQVQFFATGMKPTTTVYPFFDSVPVDAHCVAATEMTLSSVTGVFDEFTDAGQNAEQAARSNPSTGRPIRALNAGDVIHNGTGGDIALATATAAVLHYLDDDGTGAPRLYLHNVIGTFSNGQTIYGTISGATGVVDVISTPSSLKTNIYGECVGIFTIPSSEAIRFRAGERIFTLTDSVTNTNNWTTIAIAQYVAKGVFLPLPAPPVPVPVPPAPPAPEPVLPPAPPVPTSPSAPPAPVAFSTEWWASMGFGFAMSFDPSATGAGGPGGDPLAQSFTIPNNGVGMFITSMDFYFGAKDKTLPVRLELREMLNGVPTTNVVPGSRLSKLPKDIQTSTDGSVATRFTFDFPIYLEPGKDYALVLSSDSVYYQVFVSQLGEDDILTGERIAKQPLMGSLFKSQNASVWTPDQMLDLKFRVNRAKFDVSSAANVRFVNQRIGAKGLEENSIFTRSGSNKVRIFMNGHGHTAGSKVTISGVSSAINGIPADEFNDQHTVVAADFDAFVIELTSNATSTGYGGTGSIYATRNVRFDLLNLNASQMIMPGTSIKHFTSTTNQDFYKNQYTLEIQTNQNTQMLMGSLVMSEENESQYISGYKSLDVYSQLVSVSDFVSPVLDIQRMSMLCIGNRIADNYEDTNVDELDSQSIITASNISFTGGTGTFGSPTAATRLAFQKIRVGHLVTISGATNSANNVTAVVSEVKSGGWYVTLEGVSFTEESVGANVTVSVGENYISEISPEDGSADAKYVIREMNLIDPATSLKVFFDVNLPPTASVDLYYRTAPVGSPKDSLQKTNWTKVTPVSTIKKFEEPTVFFGAEYTITPDGMFDKAQIKIVMRSTNTVYVPVIKQVRMIAAT